MNPSKSIAQVLETFTQMHRDLVHAQLGPMQPRLRSELARVAAAAQHSLTRLEGAHQDAAQELEGKQQRVAAMAAANKKSINEKQQKLEAQKNDTAKTSGAPAPVKIDPTLGQRLAAELLRRQPADQASQEPSKAGGILDNWEWHASTSASSGTAAHCG